MDAVLYGAAVAAFVVAAVFYFRGWFTPTFLLGVGIWAVCARVLASTMHPLAAIPIWLLFGGFPAGFLLVHMIDIRRGRYQFPTIYAIPLAFIFGLVLLLLTGLGVLLA